MSPMDSAHLQWTPVMHEGGRTVMHLVSPSRPQHNRDIRWSRICGSDDPATVRKPDGYNYCRNCIGMEALRDE